VAEGRHESAVVRVSALALEGGSGRDPLSLVFAALADPTRRAILARLKGGPATVGELGEPFDMSGPGVSKHLRVLERAGLVSRSRVAQARPAILEAAPLEQVAEWAEEFRQFWDARFDRLDDFLATMTDPDDPTEDDA
jgi:DNA-binding transcriptional ArsR family regulator